MSSESPHQIIARFVKERESCSDEAVLQELSELAPLRDESDPVWDDDEYWRTEAYRFLALADLVAARKLRVGVRMLLERACFGDPGEAMRGLRHSLEAVFNPDWDGLRDVCLPLASSPRPGTRLWSIDQLTVLEDPSAEPILREAMSDDSQEIRDIAEIGLDRLQRKKKA